jgi:hypothetical protein
MLYKMNIIKLKYKSFKKPQTQQKYRPTTPNNKMGHFYILWDRDKGDHKTF